MDDSVRQRLKDLGIDLDNPSWVSPNPAEGPRNTTAASTVAQTRAIAERMRDLLAAQVQKDTVTLEDLRLRLDRLRSVRKDGGQ